MCDLELQVQSSQSLRTLVEGANLNQLSLAQLESIRQQIRKDLDRLDQVSQRSVTLHSQHMVPYGFSSCHAAFQICRRICGWEVLVYTLLLSMFL